MKGVIIMGTEEMKARASFKIKKKKKKDPLRTANFEETDLKNLPQRIHDTKM